MPNRSRYLPLVLTKASKVSITPTDAVPEAEPWPNEPAALVRYFLRGQPGRGAHLRRKHSGNSLAKRAGLTPQTVHRFLNAQTQPRLRTGLLIARALDISPWRVLRFWELRRRMVTAGPKHWAAHDRARRDHWKLKRDHEVSAFHPDGQDLAGAGSVAGSEGTHTHPGGQGPGEEQVDD